MAKKAVPYKNGRKTSGNIFHDVTVGTIKYKNKVMPKIKKNLMIAFILFMIGAIPESLSLNGWIPENIFMPIACGFMISAGFFAFRALLCWFDIMAEHKHLYNTYSDDY